MSQKNIYFPKDANANLNIVILPCEAEVKKRADYFNKRI